MRRRLSVSDAARESDRSVSIEVRSGRSFNHEEQDDLRRKRSSAILLGMTLRSGTESHVQFGRQCAQAEPSEQGTLIDEYGQEALFAAADARSHPVLRFFRLTVEGRTQLSEIVGTRCSRIVLAKRVVSLLDTCKAAA